MPVKNCQEDGKPGYKWGNSGKCYTYNPDDESSRKRAKQKAHKQGAAIEDNEEYLDSIVEALEPPKDT